MNKLSLIIIVVVMLFPLYPDLYAQSGSKDKLISIYTREGLVDMLGQKVADQVPGDFDFEKYKLVSFDRKKTSDNKVRILKPKSGEVLSSEWIRIKYENQSATIFVLKDTCQTAEQKACPSRIYKEPHPFFAFPRGTRVKIRYRTDLTP